MNVNNIHIYHFIVYKFVYLNNKMCIQCLCVHLFVPLLERTRVDATKWPGRVSSLLRRPE